MQLYTKSKDIYFDRIVDLFVDERQDLSPDINDITTFKLLILKSGVLHFKEQGKTRYVLAPAMILLSHEDQLQVTYKEKLQTITVYFKPTVIHDYFTYDKLFTENFEQKIGSTLNQDYNLIRQFFPSENLLAKIYNLTSSALITITNLIDHMEQELTLQNDGFWPCRSRSYFMELLFYIKYSCIEKYRMETEHAFINPTIGEIIQYLHEHMGDQLTLTELTKRFHINRNQLNAMFTKQTSMTCLAFLLQIRLDLAKIMLTETTIPVSEVGERVGFLDTNYFTKVFKKHTGKTPTIYRKELAS